jgi:heavy metal sensor kinase
MLLAVTLLTLAGLTYLVLLQVLHSRADAALEVYAETTGKQIAAKLYQTQAVPGPPPPTHLLDQDPQSWGRYVQVVDRNGRVMDASDALRSVKLPLTPNAMLRGLQGKVTFETAHDLGEHPLRIVTVPVQMGDQVPYLVQVGTSLEGVEAALQRASVILLILTPSVFLVALVGGGSLVGRSLRPVDELTRAAMEMEHRHLDRRVVPPRPDDEIGRLAGAFNEMLSRLDRSFRQIQQFSADASHELRTPLTTIRGEAEVALMGERAPEEYRRTLQSIIEEAERMSAVVENLLTLARADADQVTLRREPVALHETVMTVFEGLEGIARRKGVSLDLEEIEELSCEGDALWLQQVVTNLVANAVKFTPSGGRVWIRLTQEKNWACLSVRDTGVGIPPEHLPHIFDRFYRVDAGRSRDSGGTGLGLSIVRRLVELMGGSVTVDSELGRGSTFTVEMTLMAAADDSPLLSLPRPAPAAASSILRDEQRKVLVVDDHPVNREVLIRQLAILGIDSDSAVDGAEALAMWQSGDYALVLADIHMPTMDGYELTRQIRAVEAQRRAARTPIVAVTANVMKGEEERCLAADMDAYLGKPISIDRLQVTLERWLSIRAEPAHGDAAGAPTPSDVLDRSILGAWLGDDAAAVGSLLQKFRDAALDAELQVGDASRRSDLAALTAAAHRLKGAAAAVGAVAVEHRARSLEAAAKAGDWSRCRQELGPLAADIRRVIVEIDETAGAPR